MDDEMETELAFEAREIDLDYEYDAVMFFDFTREESPAEAREAEQWFDTAPCYPPSPFVRKLMLKEENQLTDISESTKCIDEEKNATLVSSYDCGGGHEQHSVVELDNRECTNCNRIPADKSKAKSKSFVKGHFSRSSTLMKPTASLLAKQNHPLIRGGSRFQMQLAQKDRNLSNASGSVVESQAAKRQKLEEGHMRKVGDAKQQTNFIHKVSKKDVAVERTTAYSRMRLTIPREPELETASRAARMRPKFTAEMPHVTVGRKFKARPLNRKILEAPSLPLLKKSTPKMPDFQEFHLKTSERAMQHGSAVLSSSHQHSDHDKGLDVCTTTSLTEPTRTSAVDTVKQDACGTSHIFKAHLLSNKIFSSRGDVGISRNYKREKTVPMEFNINKEKKIQHHPPIELFSKLSLGCEVQKNTGSQLQFPQSSSMFTKYKGSKENRLHITQSENKTTHLIKGRPSMIGGKHAQLLNNGCVSEVGISMRDFGVR